MCDCDSDESVMEIKSALWAIGHFSTSSLGAKYLSDRGVIKAIVGIAEKCVVYNVKATAFYVLSIIATTKEGVAALNKTSKNIFLCNDVKSRNTYYFHLTAVWKCLKRNRHDISVSNDVPFSPATFEKFSDDDDSETISSPVDFESPMVRKNLLNSFLRFRNRLKR